MYGDAARPSLERKEKFMKKVIVSFLICLGMFQFSYAQDSLRSKFAYIHSGKIGLGIDGITGSPNILMKYFFNNQFAMQILVGVDIDIPGGVTLSGFTKVNGVTLRGGFSLLLHLTQDQVSPYVGVEGVFQRAQSGGFYIDVPDPKNSFFASALVGGEFFINERFTIGIKGNLGVNVLLKRDTPSEDTDIKFATSTLVTGRFYFN